MTKSPKDPGASVRARLLRLAQARGEDFQLVLLRYANERLLYRLASSQYASQFIYDLAVLARFFDFDGALLARAVRATFERRQTSLPDGLPVALTPEFAADPSKRTQWTAFLRKSWVPDRQPLSQVVQDIVAFAGPGLAAAARGEPWAARRPAGGPWTA